MTLFHGPGSGPLHPPPWIWVCLGVGMALLLLGTSVAVVPPPEPPPRVSSSWRGPLAASPGTTHLLRADANVTGNLTAALGRLVLLVSLGAGAMVTLAWARVALSWFSHDATKKLAAKERARDAAVGSLILVLAVSGLAWGLAHWVVTGL